MLGCQGVLFYMFTRVHCNCIINFPIKLALSIFVLIPLLGVPWCSLESTAQLNFRCALANRQDKCEPVIIGMGTQIGHARGKYRKFSLAPLTPISPPPHYPILRYPTTNTDIQPSISICKHNMLNSCKSRQPRQARQASYFFPLLACTVLASVFYQLLQTGSAYQCFLQAPLFIQIPIRVLNAPSATRCNKIEGSMTRPSACNTFIFFTSPNF